MLTGRLAAAVLGLMAISQLSSSSTAVPYTFTNGTVADADEVNANFSALANAIDNKPAGPAQWVQLFDRNYTNELTSSAPLNLSNEGIKSDFTTGGFALSTNTVTNDTLTFPDTGHYFVTIQLRASFLLPLSPPPVGSTYQILFSILDANNSTLNNLVFNGIIPNDPNAVLDETLSTSFVIYDAAAPPQLKIVLSNFDFSLAFDNQLSVFDIIVVAQKWEHPAAP